jgi:hypothetical protein
MMFEILNRFFVSFGRASGFESAQVSALARLWVFFP